MKNPVLNDQELASLTRNAPASTAELASARSKTDADEVHPRFKELHQCFADRASAAISQIVKKDCVVRLREQSMSSYGEFVLGQQNPTVCGVVHSPVTKLELYMTWSPSILYPLVDRAVGGHESYEIPTRPPSEIEIAICRFLFQSLVDVYEAEWKTALALELEVDRIDFNVQAMRSLAGSESVYRVRYDIKCERDYGVFEICLPWSRTRQVRQRLFANSPQEHV